MALTLKKLTIRKSALDTDGALCRGKRDLLYRQKRPIIWEKETYYVGNRDLEYRQKRPKHLTFENEPPRYKSSIENTIENTFYLL